MKKQILFLIMTLVLLVGCTATITPDAGTSYALPTIQSSQQLIPSSTTQPTFAVASPAPTTPAATASRTPTIPPEMLQDNCLEILDRLPPGAPVTGTLVLSGHFIWQIDNPPENLEADSYFLNLSTGERIVFSPKDDQSPIVRFAVSPDGKWLAYDDIRGNNDIVVATADGQEFTRIPWGDRWWYFDWLNNEQLVINRNISTGVIDLERGRAGESSLVLFNPLTGQSQELMPDLPGIFSHDLLSDWPGSMIYNPTLTRVLYPDMRNDPPFVLWDVQAGKEVARIPYGKDPQWSPNGERLAWIVITEEGSVMELYVASQDGQIARLTYLTEYRPSTIASYSWSPDGRHIAFWMTRRRYGPLDLAVADTSTGQVTDYCVQANFGGGSQPGYVSLTNDLSPIWSPDGTQLLMSSSDPNDGEHILVVIVDIVQGYAATVAENMIPVGWMVSP